MIELTIKKHLKSAHDDFLLEAQLDIATGEFVTLFGPSGAGKTALLRCLAGLEQADEGHIRVNGEYWFDANKNMSPQQRRAGFMFQHYALFPNMTVQGNLEFALRPGTDKKRVNKLIDLTELGELRHRKPASLSGGQQQRVALARVLVSEPRLLLLDEPLSALDPSIRSRLQDEILRMQRHYGLTTVMVSHDIGEVYKLSQRVFAMEHGKITRHGRPAEVFSAGQAAGKFSFIGEVLAIEPADVVYAVTVLVGNHIVHVIATPEELNNIHIGGKVVLLSKAFNPVILPTESRIKGV